MEYMTESKLTQYKMEKFILMTFSVYNISMLVLAMLREWRTWIPFTLFTLAALAWIVHLGRYRNFRFRAMLTVITMQASVLIYGTHLDDVFSIMGIMVSFTVFAGLYGMVDVLYVTGLSSIILFFYHIVIAQTIEFSTAIEMVRGILQIGNVMLIQYVMYFWVNRRSESNEEFVKTIKTLRRAERSKDDFLANVSHEIRTPINTICGLSEVTLQEEDARKVKANLMSIQRAGKNLMSVVSDILDFSELQSGKVALEEEAYNITSTINDVINMALAKKAEKRIELVVNCDADIPSILLGDEKKIRRVILNILNNAIKFTKEGCVSVQVGSRKEAYGINLCITIKDTGIGMKAEDLEKLFTSFNQVDTKRNREEDGLGLGLAITQALVQKMGGVLTVKSKFGKGTTVKVVIPQKVIDESPIVTIKNCEKLNLAVYIDMEQFDMPEIRDEYAGNIKHMMSQVDVKCHVCRNLQEFKRRQERDGFTHVFISYVEYMADRVYFDELAEQIKVIIIIDTRDENCVQNPKISRIYKPFYILPIASVLNEECDSVQVGEIAHTNAFIAPEAHILAVDDNEMNLQVLEALLERYQIRLTKALSGKEALTKIETMDYDFVFMDHMMPEMDGVETYHRIRHKVGAYYRKVPIVALTANAIAGARESFLNEGFADFLEKPIEVSVLARVLRRNLPENKMIFLDEKEREELVQKDTRVVEQAVITEAAEQGTVVEKESEVQNEKMGTFERLKIDKQTGILYCGGEESYYKILGSYCRSGDDNRQKLEELFETEDWKNYTIVVHGVKSAMMSIGAAYLSGLAKELEFAGKRDDIDYIRKNHAQMIAEYATVIKGLQADPEICPKEIYAAKSQGDKSSADEAAKNEAAEQNAEGADVLPELADMIFRERLGDIEDAMFSLDGNRMMEIVEELEQYQYAGTPLAEVLETVRRKIEMSDYMSAVDVLQKQYKQLKSKGGDGTC